jgi:hypothetical protein
VAGTFIEMVNRITSELRRSNAGADVKNAINDAVQEAAQERFYFNKFSAIITTVAGQFGSYNASDNAKMVEIDQAWHRLDVDHNIPLEIMGEDEYAEATNFTRPSGSQPQAITRDSYGFIIYPTPTIITTVAVNGYGMRDTFPLVNDADSNPFLTESEQYIRALAKRNYLRDVVRDYGEARVYDIIAEDYKQRLVETTATKISTGRIRATKF